MRLFGSLCILAVCASAVSGQSSTIAPAAVVRARHQVTSAEKSVVAADPFLAKQFGQRVLLGTGGAVVGGLAGAFMGPVLFGRDCNGCDDPGLSQAVAGATIGAVAGASLLSAIPDRGSRCGYFPRVGLAVLGSIVGGAVGVLASGGTEVILATFPLGIGLGAASAASVC